MSQIKILTWSLPGIYCNFLCKYPAWMYSTISTYFSVTWATVVWPWVVSSMVLLDFQHKICCRACGNSGTKSSCDRLHYAACPVARHHKPLLITNCSWILATRTEFSKKKTSLKTKKMVLKNGVKRIETAGYNGARKVIYPAKPPSVYKMCTQPRLP